MSVPQALETYRATHASARSALVEALPADRVWLDLHVADKRALFQRVGERLSGVAGLSCADVVERLNERERLGSTALGLGLAIPHARIPRLDRVVAAFARTAAPIEFDAPDARFVTDLLILLVPQQATERHLEMLASVAEMFGDARFRDRLRAAADPAAIHRLLVHWPES
jgi:PTS system nitrogen regulatory IIA component